MGSKKSFYIFAFDKRLISLFEISIYNICMHAQRIHYQPLIMDTTTNKRESNNVYYQTDVTENITCEEYDRKRHPLFQTETLAKDQSVSYNRIDCSALVFVMEGTVRVSTATYLQDVVEEGNMFVVHELDSVCIRGVEDAVMIYCLFNSSMALCNGLSLKSFSTPPEKIKRQQSKDSLPTLPIQKLLVLELTLIRKETEKNLLELRFMKVKRYLLLMMLRRLYHNDDLIYMFRYKPGEDFEFRELVFRHFSCDMNAQQLAALTQIPVATFNRKFKKAFGMPVMKWINTKRKLCILIDLKTTDMTIKEIAAKYNITPNYLSNFCKKHLGDTPANLRENY